MRRRKINPDPLSKALAVQGVYRPATDGTVTLLIDDLSRPNGIVFSPDQQLLYVANSDESQPVIMVYPVEPNGELGNGKVFFKSWGDGLTVDQQGRLYVAGPSKGVMILSPAMACAVNAWAMDAEGAHLMCNSLDI